MSSSSTTQTTLNHHQLTSRILNENSLHFILLSLLLLPFTVSASTAIHFYISSSQNLLTLKTLITILTSTCFIILPTITGIALTTSSTHHAMHHKPLTFSSTLKYLSHADTILLYVVIVRSIKLIILLIAFTLSSIVITEGVNALAFHFCLPLFSLFLNVIVSYILAIIIVFYILVCDQTAANESITEYRLYSFCMVFRTGFAVVPALSYSSVSLNYFGPIANWILVMQFGTICLQSSLMILQYVVENTVLYVHCMLASEDEIVKTRVEEAVFGEYVRLVMNDTAGEVRHEVAEEANGGFDYMLYLLTVVWVFLLCVQFYYIFTFYKSIWV